MARELDRRLRFLEQSLRSGASLPCEACGLDGAPGDAPEAIEVLWEDIDDVNDDLPDEPEFCAECGRQTVYVVTWEDLEDPEPGGGGR